MAFLLASCSTSVTSENAAREEFTSGFCDLIDKGLVVIHSFSQVNAQGGAKDGWYKIEYQAIIRYANGIHTGCIGKTDFGAMDIIGFGKWTEEVGAVDEVSGSVEFEMTEKGWRGKESGTMY